MEYERDVLYRLARSGAFAQADFFGDEAAFSNPPQPLGIAHSSQPMVRTPSLKLKISESLGPLRS